ncbi:carboxylesterase/lipase family protein [Rhizobium sp. AG207R]|uniref:carboxylesterase/lipase family protein n=1 Tax=Rhizobium sp. AG207R TaxID=2802287 RepID=UPI0022AC0A25|nr:carboxylesterase family protein [Rhizobium sp. AG207R]
MTEETQNRSLVIETPYGPIVGRRSDGVIAFTGVPYALPPIGPRRFRLPEPIHPWNEPLDCTRQSSIAPQLPSRLAKVMGDYPAQQDEDCLHLDIWVPEKRSAKTPIFVFLHGGAFMTGGGSLPCYDGALLARNAGMIVVTITYRLGALGFLPIRGVAPGNLGLHDQVAALRFIRDIAPAFDGDVANITVSGQSAGALSIALLLAAPGQDALFNRSIIMSAPLGLDLPNLDVAERIGEEYMRALGLESGDRRGIEAQPIERLMAAQLEVAKAHVPPPGDLTPAFLPVIDGNLISMQARDALQGGVAAGRAIMIGTTREEMTSFYLGNEALAKIADEVATVAFRRRFGADAESAMRRARARRVPGTALALLTDLMTDEVFVGSSLSVAQAQAKSGHSAYVYRFDWQSPTPNIQACHCIELPFLFANFDTWRVAPMLAGADRNELADLSRIFQGALVAFARSGKPEASDLPAWPVYGTRQIVQHFGTLVQAASAA